MSLFSTLKRNAKRALKGNWGTAVLILVISAGVMMALTVFEQALLRIFVVDPSLANPTMELPPASLPEFLEEWLAFSPLEAVIMFGCMLLTVLFNAPIQLGIAGWYFTLVRGERLPMSEVFRFFESPGQYWRSVWYYININVRSLLWAIPFFLVPGALAGVSAYYVTLHAQDTDRSIAAMATMGLFVSAVLFLFAAVLYSIYINRYLLAPYLLCEDDSIGVGAAIKLSVRYSRGFRFGFFLFGLSFIGWIFLTAMLLFLPFMYVMPYMSASFALYGRYVIEKNRYVSPEATREFIKEEE